MVSRWKTPHLLRVSSPTIWSMVVAFFDLGCIFKMVDVQWCTQSCSSAVADTVDGDHLHRYMICISKKKSNTPQKYQGPLNHMVMNGILYMLGYLCIFFWGYATRCLLELLSKSIEFCSFPLPPWCPRIIPIPIGRLSWQPARVFVGILKKNLENLLKFKGWNLKIHPFGEGTSSILQKKLHFFWCSMFLFQGYI